MLTLKLAWRNIWRNKRRSLITMASIIIAVLLSAIMRSMQEGQYGSMIETTVGSFSGYIQVHGEGYWDDQTLDNSFKATDSLMQVLESPESVTAIVPRIETFALGAGAELSRPMMVFGIDTEAEQHIIDPHEKIKSGNYFDNNAEQAVLVGADVLERLNMQLGDSLVLIGQGFHGLSARGLYKVKGTVSFTNPQMNRNFVLLPLQTAQRFLAAEGRLTSVSIMVEETDQISSTLRELKERVPTETYEVMGWREMQPELVQSIEVDRASGIIILAVLYMVVGFGILGTILMMVTERTYELGIMLSVGTARKKIAGILAIEMFFLSMMGSAIGIMLSYPIAWYFNINPIPLSGDFASASENYGLQATLTFSVEPSIFLNQAVIILIITLGFSLFPILKASNLNPVYAMRA